MSEWTAPVGRGVPIGGGSYMRKLPLWSVGIALVLLGSVVAHGAITTQTTALQAASAAPGAAVNIDARPFPREFTVRGTSFSIHQPQYDSWEGNQLKGRSSPP